MSKQTPLTGILCDEIRSTGPISFARFMELCLYHPEHGYYTSARAKLGAAGDFYTSAHVAPVFARILGQHLERHWTAMQRPDPFDWVELGAADGQLAAELLPWVRQRSPDFFACLRYTAVERSPSLRRRLEENLEIYGPKVKASAKLPEGPSGSHNGQSFQGLIFANEFFDALPVHLLEWRRDQWQERLITCEGGKLTWSLGEPNPRHLASQADSRFDPALNHKNREEGWPAEICPRAEEYLSRIAENLDRGEALVIDYGYTLEEWQKGRFPRGSALGYRRHRTVEDLLAEPGLQDLTAHVNFSQLSAVGRQKDLGTYFFGSQTKFLMEIGREDEFACVFLDCQSETERARRAQLLKTLIVPGGMGEVFRVLQMTKNI